MNKRRWGLLLGASLVLGASAVPSVASACGGFFCSQSQGVNQAAERIVFAYDGDGRVTAVIEIMYQGPAEKFSWLLPISSVPEGDQIAVGSSTSFQRLQQATNPQFFLTTRVEGTCAQDEDDAGGFGGDGSASAAGGAGSDPEGNGVTVEASGLVGSFEWAVISVKPELPAPADAAVAWLEANAYDVPEGAPGLLGPYLDDGMFLLALRLQKGADAGSIRPIVLTYDATKPMIPIKLTAVAANDDMGVLTWVLADHQAVPQNYYALELNEARINWFNPNSNYNDVVIEAADEAGGQGFVTEYAAAASSLMGQIWRPFEQTRWEQFKARAPGLDPREMAVDAMFEYSPWDGFWDVFRKHVTLPPDVTLAEVQSCWGESFGFGGAPSSADCGSDDYQVSANFLSALEAEVIVPAQVMQQLVDSHQSVTRLYSTLSAAEMTVDPLFTFNPDLDPVSNVHRAERVIECAPHYSQFEAPWRIELPQGGEVRGGPDDFGIWPAAFNDQPANRRILRQGESGPGQVLEDNSAIIDADISTYSAGIPRPTKPPEFPRDRGPALTPEDPGPPGAQSDDLAVSGGGCACRVAGAHSTSGLLWALLAAGTFGAAVRRARGRRSRSRALTLR